MSERDQKVKSKSGRSDRRIPANDNEDPPPVREILPKRGYLHYEDSLSFVLSKPKLLPLKSFTMEKLEQIQAESIQKSKLIMESGNIE